MAFLRLILPVALVCATAEAQRITVLKAARMFDGHEMRTPGLVIVNGSSIVGVGPNAAIPPGAQTIDFGDATLSPGFIDAHTHLSYLYYANYAQQEIDGNSRTVAEQTLGHRKICARR